MMLDTGYTDAQAAQIARAFTRAEDARLTVRLGHMDSGRPCFFVDSQRADHARQAVYRDDDGRPNCTCEAMYYRRGSTVVCVHIATVTLRMLRAKKRGTRAAFRHLKELVGADVVPYAPRD